VARFRYSYSISVRSAEELSRPIYRLAELGYDAVELDPRAVTRSGLVPSERREDPTPYLVALGIEHLKRLESEHEV
jgi:hypothetical protein